MRWFTQIGLVLIAVGALVAVASTGAFDSLDADRGVSIETAPDADALVGIEYADEVEEPYGGLPVLELDSDESDSGGGCFVIGCSEYQYNDRELVIFEDNTVAEELMIEDATISSDDDAITGGNGLRNEQDRGIGIVRGDFRCSSRGFIGPGDQQQRSAVITVDIVASDGDITIEFERDIAVECIPD